jgi:hypothetical protein
MFAQTLEMRNIPRKNPRETRTFCRRNLGKNICDARTLGREKVAQTFGTRTFFRNNPWETRTNDSTTLERAQFV